MLLSALTRDTCLPACLDSGRGGGGTGQADPVCRFLCSLHFSYRQFARLISDQQSASSAFAANRIRAGRSDYTN